MPTTLDNPCFLFTLLAFTKGEPYLKITLPVPVRSRNMREKLGISAHK
jgi:hypothetical protein